MSEWDLLYELREHSKKMDLQREMARILRGDPTAEEALKYWRESKAQHSKGGKNKAQKNVRMIEVKEIAKRTYFDRPESERAESGFPAYFAKELIDFTFERYGKQIPANANTVYKWIDGWKKLP